uniref:Phosphatidate cytidylyltransferase n=1 Tax=Eimeria falciformis TaxID=84963 RepID=A0A1L2DZL7_9EIME|nr:cytidine diphosphate-diacylglycerol synthase 1 [Eimeria falciformis]
MPEGVKMRHSDSEAAPPVSSEAAASGWDEGGTEPVCDSDDPCKNNQSASTLADALLQRPRLRCTAAAAAQQQQLLLQHRNPRAALPRRLKGGSVSSNGHCSSIMQQQQLLLLQSNGGFKGTAAAAETWQRRFATFRVRCRWTLILIFLFFLILAAGHAYCMILVLCLIGAIYKEIIQAKERREEERLPDFHLLKWYWFCVTIIGIGLPWCLRRLRGIDASIIEWILGFHSLGFYVMWFLGFIWFILSLRKSYLRYQFSQLGVMLVVLLFVVSQSLIQIANIYSGLIWFFLPTSLVIVNDIFAYLCGTAFGRTQLIRLSPKKTVEGYIGAAVVTLLWAWVVGRQLERHPMFICPQPYISFEPFAVFRDLSCTPSPVFVPRCTDSPIERFGMNWWAADMHQQQQQQLQQQRVFSLLKEHQTLMTQAAATDEQLVLLEGQQHQEQQQQQEKKQVHALQQRIWARLSAVEKEREIAEAGMRKSCRSLFASPFDFHAMVLGTFAAFFAPFGGFFASGFKRAVRIKDFGYFIPGHGGVTDRFDCQVVMGLFTFLYQKTFVPQIGEAEAAARRTARQKQQVQQLQQQPREQQEGAQESSSKGMASIGTRNCTSNRQEQLASAGSGDPAVDALVHAAQGLSAAQLATLQRSLEAMAAAKAAAGD